MEIVKIDSQFRVRIPKGGMRGTFRRGRYVRITPVGADKLTVELIKE